MYLNPPRQSYEQKPTPLPSLNSMTCGASIYSVQYLETTENRSQLWVNIDLAMLTYTRKDAIRLALHGTCYRSYNHSELLMPPYGSGPGSYLHNRFPMAITSHSIITVSPTGTGLR